MVTFCIILYYSLNYVCVSCSIFVQFSEPDCVDVVVVVVSLAGGEALGEHVPGHSDGGVVVPGVLHLVSRPQPLLPDK